ncbi:MAG: NAD-dependent epimerase/dehydratase family protein [Candidatus Thorarchaeota archaeon]|jgi:nucleoside-diphosphate-sugar epimerase
MVRSFVTGGTGFVGSYIVKLLSEGNHDVTILKRTSSSLDLLDGLTFNSVVGDVTDLNSLEAGVPEDTEWFFHNAAIMKDWGGKSQFFPVNVEGTRSVLEVIRKKDIPKLIHTSSTAVYGFPNIKDPLSEDAPWKPMNTYQRSKAAAEELIREYGETYGIRATMIRGPTVLGKGDMFTGPQLIDRITNGNMFTIGGGNNSQSFAHGEDFAKCLLLAAENFNIAEGNAFNVTSFICTFRELLEAIADEVGASKDFTNIPYTPSVAMGAAAAGLYRAFHKKNSPLITPFRVKLFGSTYIIDNTKARENLGYEPSWNLQTTVQEIVQWGGTIKAR